jgi:hypothetical protein
MSLDIHNWSEGHNLYITVLENGTIGGPVRYVMSITGYWRQLQYVHNGSEVMTNCYKHRKYIFYEHSNSGLCGETIILFYNVCVLSSYNYTRTKHLRRTRRHIHVTIKLYIRREMFCHLSLFVFMEIEVLYKKSAAHAYEKSLRIT